MNHWSHTLRDKGPRLIQALVVLGALACGPTDSGFDGTRRSVYDVCAQIRDDIEILNMRLERMDSIVSLSARHGIDVGLATAIVDVALAEELLPDLGARLVRVESGFRVDDTGAVGEAGYTQIRLSTARGLGYRGTLRELYEPEVNLRYGFRYLRRMLDRYDGNVERALTAYNGGPGLADTGFVLVGYVRKVTG